MRNVTNNCPTVTYPTSGSYVYIVDMSNVAPNRFRMGYTSDINAIHEKHMGLYAWYNCTPNRSDKKEVCNTVATYLNGQKCKINRSIFEFPSLDMVMDIIATYSATRKIPTSYIGHGMWNIILNDSLPTLYIMPPITHTSEHDIYRRHELIDDEEPDHVTTSTTRSSERDIHITFNINITCPASFRTLPFPILASISLCTLCTYIIRR